MKDFIEKEIIEAVKKLLKSRVNELIRGFEFQIPFIEFGNYQDMSAITPVLSLRSCERTEKERIIKQDAYSLTITISVPETHESELHCYAYSNAISEALGEDVTLGGIADRAIITGKKYAPPEKPNRGIEWELIVSLRITAEAVQ